VLTLEFSIRLEHRKEVNTMADILELQDQEQDPEETPGTEKASRVSYYKLCRNSYISVSACFVK
jgi:hypothetical protein